jgi:crotonobetaine/carnitine-CoA ligase
VRRVAGFLSGLGIKAGDRVLVLLPNSCDFVRVWLGLGMLGAIAVLLNTQLRGAFLRHQLKSARAELLVVDSSLLGSVTEVLPECPELKQIVLIKQHADENNAGIAAIDWDDWRGAKLFESPPPSAQDLACIMYTSGTSGPAKGVLMPHAHCALFGIGIIDALQIQADDRYYISLPLFHANGLLMQLGATLLAGIPAVIRPRFSASEWSDDIRTHGATVTHMLGALAAFVLGQPPSPDDRKHRLRAMLNAPNLLEHEAEFRERFGVRDVISGFGMTEANNPILGRVGHPCPGASGWVRSDHFEVIVADPETDSPFEPGHIGEILVRPKMPFGFMAGYHDMPEKTVEAWRNLWFHTGDAGIMDSSGLVTFVDRIKDCIRRRGENIAATEVEVAVGMLAGVREVAAFAVPSEIAGGEDEVMLAIVPVPGINPSLKLLGEQAEAVLPRFARPRFLELMDELPKTGTGKVQRAALRKRGSAAAYDRDLDNAASPRKR